MRTTYDNIIDTDNLVALNCPRCVDFSEEGKAEYPEKKPSKHRRDELQEYDDLSHHRR